MDALRKAAELDAGVGGRRAVCGNHLIPGSIPAATRDGDCRGRGCVRGPKDAMPDVAQVPHIDRSRSWVSRWGYSASWTMIL